MTVARLFGIIILIHISFCFGQIDPSDYGVGDDDHNAPAPGSFGKYFVYVNCTTCEVKSELQVQEKNANEGEEYEPEENSKNANEREVHEPEEETKTTRKRTHYPSSPRGGRTRIGRKTTPYGVMKKEEDGGRVGEGYEVPSGAVGRGKQRKTTPYREEGEEEGEEVEEQMEERARLEGMKVNETTASRIYHLPGDTPYPPWFTVMADKTTKKTGTGSTGTEVIGTAGTDTEVTSSGETSSEVTGIGLTGIEIIGTGQTDTKNAKEGEEHEPEEKTKNANGGDEHEPGEKTKTTRKRTHYPSSPRGGRTRIGRKTAPYGLMKKEEEGGRGGKGYTVPSGAVGRGKQRKTTPYEEEDEREEVKEQREERARLERLKFNETTASRIYHLPGDTPYPPWFTDMVDKTTRKTGTGSTGKEVIGTGGTGTEVTGTGETSTEVTGTGLTGIEVIGTGQTGTRNAKDGEEHEPEEETKTNRKRTHYPSSPRGERTRIGRKTTPYGVMKKEEEGGRGGEGYAVPSGAVGRGKQRKTTPYGEEGEGEKVKEQREERARLERMKINETTASLIYHLPGDTPYPPWFTVMAFKTMKKTDTGSTGTEVIGTGGTGTEVTSTGQTGTAVKGTEETGTEVKGTEETGTEVTSIGEESMVETTRKKKKKKP